MAWPKKAFRNQSMSNTFESSTDPEDSLLREKIISHDDPVIHDSASGG